MAKKTEKPSSKATPSNASSVQVFDKWCDKNLNFIFYATLLICVVFSALLFDIRVSLTGDDSNYVIRAWDFVKDFKYPSFQGPLYPLALSPIIAIMGISMGTLKFLSLIFMAGFFIFFHFAFRNRIPASIHACVLILLSINSYLLYYASQTYSEAMFMFILAATITGFFTWFVDDDTDKSIKTNWKQFLYISLLILALILTRSVGFGILAVIWIYFASRKQWKNILWITIFVIALYLLFLGLKAIIWNSADSTFSSQGSSLLYKNYYNQQEGKEDLAGLVVRFFENTQLYVSKHFYMMLGMRDDDPTIPKNSLLTVLFLAVATISFVKVFKNNRYLFFASLVAVAFCGLTFVMLQTQWDQGRLIVPFFPFIILFILGGIYYLLKQKDTNLTFMLPIVAALIFFPTLSRAADHIKAASKINSKYYGLTPDWENYTKLSEWTGKNLPADKTVACRKPSISFIYSKGRKFFSLDRVPLSNSKTYMNMLNADTSNVVVLSNRQLANNLMALIPQFSPYLQADVITGETLHFVYQVPNEDKAKFHKLLNDNSIKPLSLKYLQTEVAKSPDTYTVYPDSLLLNLKNRNVGYVLSASLRKYSAQKTNETINTVERYMLFVETKYPGIFQRTMQMGANDDEPAWIYEIRYNQFGLK